MRALPSKKTNKIKWSVFSCELCALLDLGLKLWQHRIEVDSRVTVEWFCGGGIGLLECFKFEKIGGGNAFVVGLGKTSVQIFFREK